jgi:glutamyl-tRNA reductase
VPLDARFLIIGAGQTNMLMAKFLKKHGFKNFSIYNRTLANAQKLADELSGTAHKLTDLAECKSGFDVILTCTAASEHIISAGLYQTLLNNETDKKIIIDLSVPTDTDPLVLATFNLHFIDVATIQAIANENMQERRKELSAVHHIIESAVKNFAAMHKVRKVELAMSEVPKKIKEIRETAVKEVFAKDLENLDQQSKEVLDKILAYVEKKYITVPMKMAREIIIEN